MQYSKPTPDHLVLNFAAIDIGYFSVKCASHRISPTKINTFSFPSVTPIHDRDYETHHGMAGSAGVIIEHDGDKYYVGPDSHTHTQNFQPRATNLNYVKTLEYEILYLGGLYFILRELGKVMEGVKKVTIKRMVGGLPLNTIGNHKQFVRELMEGDFKVPGIFTSDSISVSVKSASIIPQPQGALYAATETKTPEEIRKFFDNQVLVLDLGGGTFDWFLVESKKFMMMRSDAYPKGMLHAVKDIINFLSPSDKDDELMIKKVDDALRNDAKSIKVNGVDIPMEKCQPHIHKVMRQCLTAMQAKVQSFSSLDSMIFTGGGAKFLIEVARQMYPNNAQLMELTTDPIYANVRGYFILAEISDAKQK